MTTKFRMILLLAICLVIAGLSFQFLFRQSKKSPQPLVAEIRTSSDLPAASASDLVGTGSSQNADPTLACREALKSALAEIENETPDVAIFFANNFLRLDEIDSQARQILGSDTQIFGALSSSRAVMTQRGLLDAGPGESNHAGLAVMLLKSSDIRFGVGSADYSASNSVREATRRAVEAALVAAGSPSGRPSAVIVLSSYTQGEDVALGLEDALGKAVPMVGGCVAGTSNGVIGKQARSTGVAVLVLYTELPIGWTYEGGFDVSDAHSGEVTAVSADGRQVDEIDGRPAADVYDEWTDGQLRTLFAAMSPGEAIDRLTLLPCYRKFRSKDGRVYTIFTHVWPTDPTFSQRSLQLGARVEKGERVYLARGSWETLLNRIGNLPVKAKVQAGMDARERSVFGIGIVCSGVLGAIPELERPKIPVLLDYSHEGAPFLGIVTGGELGNLPGIGNKFGNLLTSFLTVGPRPQSQQAARLDAH